MIVSGEEEGSAAPSAGEESQSGWSEQGGARPTPKILPKVPGIESEEEDNSDDENSQLLDTTATTSKGNRFIYWFSVRVLASFYVIDFQNLLLT